ncbi:putative phosphoserine aminotransferase, chloroplastic-like [Capsicum annuum]|nr:putative phosphoserine aminotransferase, chloroplastic-like [Capsicum annuum]
MTNESQMQVAAMTIGETSIALTSRANSPQPMAPAEKPRKFMGIDFKRWWQKMFFYLTTLCLQRFTTEDAPEVPEGALDNEHFMNVESWKHSNFLCRNYILSGLQDDLYNAHSGTMTSKELWRALEKKYKTEDAGIKKFFVARFFDFKMKDSKLVVSQVQELQVIIQDLLAEECNLLGNPHEWWTDSGVIHHVYANKELFSSFVPAQVEEMIYMANSTTAKKNDLETFKEAMSSSDLSFWKEAINSKIDSILSNHTWELVDLPLGNKPLGSKWIFKRKMKADGTIDKYKARFVVKGFKQKEVYSLEIHQMDVKITFLHGELEDEIYMEQPEGFMVPGKETKINEYDKYVYIKDTPIHQVIVYLYVDDMLIISKDISDINAMKRMLESKFDIKDLGVVDVILGIRIYRTPQGLALSQSHYIKKVLDKFKYMEFGKMTNESQMQDVTTTMGATSIASTSRANALQPMESTEKLKKFVGIDFKRWQQEIFFYLTTLCLKRFTTEDAPEVLKGTSDKEHFMIVEFLKHSDFLCRNYILISLQDDLYSVYILIVNEAFQVAVIIEKLTPMWKDFKNYLKHKLKEMTVEDLIVRLHMEEDNKAVERRSKGNSTINGAHIVEDDQNNSKKRKKDEQKSHQPKKKFKGKCFNYGKIILKFMDCRVSKKGNKKYQANIIESNKECDNLCAMFSECNLVGNPCEWWMDSGAIRHVCANKELFSSFAPAQVEEMIYMANSAMAKVLDKFKYIEFGIVKTPLDVSFALQKNEGFSNSNWITGSNEVKSTSGYVSTIGGGAVSWKSSKQTCIARSIMEAKFIALDKVGEEVEWLWNFFEDIPYWPKPVASICIHGDSQAAIGRAESIMYNGKSRHIRWRHITLRELLSSGIITIDYVK